MCISVRKTRFQYRFVEIDTYIAMKACITFLVTCLEAESMNVLERSATAHRRRMVLMHMRVVFSILGIL